MPRLFTSLLLIFTLLYISGCNKKNENPEDKPQQESAADEDNQKTGFKKLDDFVDNIKKMQKEMDEGKEVEVVDFRILKEMLPENIGDLKRVSATGEKTNSLGINVSKAEGKYRNESAEMEENQNLDVEITDLGNVKGWAGLAMWAWTFSEIDKETEDGYEKTFKMGNSKGFESYNTRNKHGKVEVFVGERYMVKVEGNNVSMETIKDALDDIGIARLEEMKNEGVTYKDKKAE